MTNDATNKTYPYESGDFIIIGPECFTDHNEDVIAYKGSNYVRVPDKLNDEPEA